MSMSGASIFWLDTLHNCNLGQSLPLLYDRYRLSDEHRTGRGTFIYFDFGEDLSDHFLAYALLKKVQPKCLALALYYVFLFKLINGEKDLCIGMNIDNRYRYELKSIIGLFENIIPLRCQLDPRWSLDELIGYVCGIVTNSMKYSYFPFQHILNQHSKLSQPTFPGIFFEFQSIENNKNLVMISDTQLHPMFNSFNINESQIMNKIEFLLTIQYDINNNQLSYTINASLDLFNRETIENITQRFHSISKQMFSPMDNGMKKPIYELSLTIPDEQLLMKSINNTQILFPPTTCIHHKFIDQVTKYPQKLAVELDDQSLTYSELLYYVQVLSVNLLNNYHIDPNEIICQCLERSLSMAS